MTKTCYTHLSPEERATLSLGLAQGHSLRMMDSVEAKTLLLNESMKYRAKSYSDLKRLLGRQDTYEVSGPSGIVYQLEVQAFWDDKPDDILRISAAIDDKGMRAYMPMIEDFLIAPDGTFVDEWGRL